MEDAHKSDKRKATNVTLSESLIAEAKALKVNISRASEEGLKAAVKKRKEEQWLAENAEAIKYHNEWFEKNGLPVTPFWMRDDVTL